MKDGYVPKPLVPPLHTGSRTRIYTAAAILAAIAYTFGVVTSPLLSYLACKDAGNSSREPIRALPMKRTEVFALPVKTTEVLALPVQNSQQSTDNLADLVRFDRRCAEPVPSERVRQAILDALFNGTSPFAGFPPEHARTLLRPRRIKGWGSTGTVFERLIKEVRPRTIVELGTFLGASALHMAALARDLGLNTQVLCVDDFRGWPGFRQKFRDIQILNGDVMLFYQFMQNVASMNLTGTVVPVPYSTAVVLRALCEWGIYADLVEVDAAHDFHSAWADINAAYAILRPGGVMFGHDYHTMMDNRGVRRAVNLFAKLKKLRVEPDGQHWVLRPLP